MKFTRLRLVGFKSFCDATELHLEPGLSGVVGPNGCGKSNLVEAMRWVMGESSYKAMRGSGMDDVIFSGSGSRPARNSAEVTLVLDNGDRTAPAHLNTADILEVTRRIEREAGSVYRINGREVRARDVQLLFADASTGAHSPALVRQGQIGELIAAKPTQRRALLEEAAGISGLHSRRHEAELRLRAAEQNLTRVDDIVAQVEQQLETLKRQARLAVRYRALSGDIRKAEAALFHLRWVKARVAEKEAEAEQGRLTRQLADASHVELEAQKAVFLARQAVQPQREAEAAAGAAQQRLVILLEQLDAEQKRMAAALAEIGRRLAQTDADIARESQLLGESEAALARYESERTRLETELVGSAESLAAARSNAEAASERVETAAHAARLAGDRLAAIRARRAQQARSLAEAEAREARLGREASEAEQLLARIDAELAASDVVMARREALTAAQAAAGAAEAAALAAETAARDAQQAVDAARPELQQLDTMLKGLETERTTLDRILKAGSSGGAWPAIAESLSVAAGYEQALGAALGEDLEAAADARAPVHWAGSAGGLGDPALPEGAVPLSQHVSGSPLLARRLAQVGLVEPQDGARLAALLQPGQMLVTREGALWRWDGLVAMADAPSAAAQRLAQRNRLAELDAEIIVAWRARTALAERAAGLAQALQAARAAERTRHEAARAAQRDIAQAQAALDKAQRDSGALSSRRSAQAEAARRLASDLAEAVAAVKAARALDNEDGEEVAAARAVSEAEAELTTRRGMAEEARLRLGAIETEARLRSGRIAQISEESTAWQKRRDAAARQGETLEARRADIAAEQAQAETSPARHEEQRRTLEEQLSAAEAAHRAAADALAEAESGFAEADKAQRLAAEALSGTREQLGRVEERIAGFAAQRQQIERLTFEALGLPATRTAEAAGIRPQDALPGEIDTERRIDRLKAERERLGGVNLGAERESEEVREKLDLMVADRDDLIAAIATLRGGIQNLNREGRARLSEAFERVNGFFQELFTTLFGGGTAELRFVESDDPLEAGLEIFAQPPGKKPQTMTLLSGGEQALTAMSLIFAVFLTNPAPICVLDEVDAPLDDANVERFCTLLDSMRRRTDTRFLVITHNPITMSRVDRLFGVTMAERGVSQLVSVDLRQAEAFREAG